MDRNLLIVLAISLLSTVAGVVFYRVMSEPEFISANKTLDFSPTSSAIEQPDTISFSEIVLNDLQTQPHHLTEWKKPLLIVNFWAPWCPPCRREIPDLIELQTKYQDKMQLIGLSFDSLQNVTDFSQKNPMNYPLLLVQSEASMINRYFGNSGSGLPFTAILNQQREIVFKHSGEINKQQLETQIKALL